MGGCVVRIPFVSSSFMLLPWCRIDRFQSLAVSRPEMYWNSFGVIHVSCCSPQLIKNFQLVFDSSDQPADELHLVSNT